MNLTQALQGHTWTPPATPPPLPRFLTLGGATVAIFEHSYTHHGCDYEHEKPWTETHKGYAWRCLGCPTEGSHYVWNGDEKFPTEDLAQACAVANEHAHDCRAMPKEARR